MKFVFVFFSRFRLMISVVFLFREIRDFPFIFKFKFPGIEKKNYLLLPGKL